MKIRIRGNSVRMRLTRSEIAALDSEGALFETTSFGADSVFRYGVRLDPAGDAVTAQLTDEGITIDIPEAAGRQWCESDEVSLGAEMGAGENQSLGILVEKDFACLSPRDDEDESDMFPHPDAGTKTC